MTPAQTGIVLAAMSRQARERAESRKAFLGPENTGLLWEIAHVFHAGAEAALKEAERETAETTES